MEENPFPTIFPALAPTSSPATLSPSLCFLLLPSFASGRRMRQSLRWGLWECVCLQHPFLLNGSSEAEIVRNDEYLD